MSSLSLSISTPWASSKPRVIIPAVFLVYLGQSYQVMSGD